MKKALGIGGIVLAAVSANANLVVNGSFESGSGFPDNWILTAGNIDYIGSYWNASDGLMSLDMNGSTGGTISQAITTIAGSSYTVTFDYSANPDGGLPTKTANANIIDIASSSLVASDAISYDTVANGNLRVDMKWRTTSFSFVATGTSTLVQFVGTNSGDYGIALDNVRVVEAVPEPASMAALGLGVLGMLRKRKAK